MCKQKSTSYLSSWRATMVASHEISIFLGLLAYTETNPATHIHTWMRSQFGSIPSLIHELTSLVLLVSFMARWDAAHGQHYGSTFWKSGVGWNKEVPRQRVCRRGNHQQWAWVIINSEWLVGKLFSFAVMHEGWVRPPSRETIWARPPSSEIVPKPCL